MKRKSLFWFFSVLCLFIFLIPACKAPTEIKDGSRAFKVKQYDLAVGLLKEEINGADELEKIEKTIMIADAYRLNNKPIEAEDWYFQAYELWPEDSFAGSIGIDAKAK